LRGEATSNQSSGFFGKGLSSRGEPNVCAEWRMQRFLAGQTFGFLLSIFIVAGITVLYRQLLPANQPLLRFVPAGNSTVSAVGEWRCLFMSVVAMLTFNICFLPPVGNFSIADPQNGVPWAHSFFTSIHGERFRRGFEGSR